MDSISGTTPAAEAEAAATSAAAAAAAAAAATAATEATEATEAAAATTAAAPEAPPLDPEMFMHAFPQRMQTYRGMPVRPRSAPYQRVGFTVVARENLKRSHTDQQIVTRATKLGICKNCQCRPCQIGILYWATKVRLQVEEEGKIYSPENDRKYGIGICESCACTICTQSFKVNKLVKIQEELQLAKTNLMKNIKVMQLNVERLLAEEKLPEKYI